MVFMLTCFPSTLHSPKDSDQPSSNSFEKNNHPSSNHLKNSSLMAAIVVSQKLLDEQPCFVVSKKLAMKRFVDLSQLQNVLRLTLASLAYHHTILSVLNSSLPAHPTSQCGRSLTCVGAISKIIIFVFFIAI